MKKMIKKKTETSVIPSTSVTLKSVSISVAIMSFLACIATGTLFVIWKTAESWTADLSSEMTLQIRTIDGQDHQKQIASALAILDETRGIISAKALARDENEALLEPWLGRGIDLSSLPVPSMIIIALDVHNPPDISALEKQLSQTVVGASLDTHRLWLHELKKMANTIIITGFIILLLILSATALTIVFATRAAVAASGEVVAVLDLVGARAFYIANQFEKHFLKIGIIGGSIGSVLALTSFWIAGVFSHFSTQSAVNVQLNFLFGGFTLPLEGYIGIFIIFIFVIFITTITSRLAVLRYLKDPALR